MHVILNMEKGQVFKCYNTWLVVDEVSQTGFTVRELRNSLAEPSKFTNHEFGKLILSGDAFFFHDHHIGRFILEGLTDTGVTVYLTTQEGWTRCVTDIQLLQSFPCEKTAGTVKASDFYGIAHYKVIPYNPETFKFKDRGY